MNIIPETRMFASVFAVSDICRRRALRSCQFLSLSGAFPRACFELFQTFELRIN